MNDRRAPGPADPPEPRPQAIKLPGGYYLPGQGWDPTALSWSTVEEQLRSDRNYWVCTTQPDGRPHTAPVWGMWLRQVLYFGTDRASQKARNISRDPRLSVHLESGDEVAIIEGQAEEVSDGSLLSELEAAFTAKYGLEEGPDEPEVVWYALSPRTVSAWRERILGASATRWRFPER